MKTFIIKFKMLIRYIILKLHYKTKGLVKIKGKIYMDNPNVFFGKNNVIFEGVKFAGSGNIIIGNNVSIGSNTILYSDKEVKIGDNTMIAAQCYIIDCDHGITKGIPMREQGLISKEIVIGKDVWIAAGAKILKGVKLADGVVIGAGSVVTSKLNTKDNEIYAGVPAKKISDRKEE